MKDYIIVNEKVKKHVLYALSYFWGLMEYYEPPRRVDYVLYATTLILEIILASKIIDQVMLKTLNMLILALRREAEVVNNEWKKILINGARHVEVVKGAFEGKYSCIIMSSVDTRYKLYKDKKLATMFRLEHDNPNY